MQGTNGTDSRRSTRLHSLSQSTVFGSIWKQILILSTDPHPEVAHTASIIVDCVHENLIQSPMGNLTQNVIEDILRFSRRTPVRKIPSPEPVEHVQNVPNPPPELPRQQSYLSLGSLRKTASSLRNLAFGAPHPQDPPSSPPKTSATQTSPQKPQEPPKPVNTPRGRLPAEWSRPPETNDPTTSLGAYHQAVTPTSPGFDAEQKIEQPTLPLTSSLLDWSTEVTLALGLQS